MLGSLALLVLGDKLLAALKDGQALLVDEFDITAAQLRQLIAHAADREPAAVQ
ncbi:hypothetical protein [Synechococcus sp. CBW1002]|uniref:hypothetical protein n=1 Tax=Synechococcus sp. CBW1002 TaxID=1353134 RepID=UPI001E4D5232|nr:hypothetical protein [Synechococcus sp. CBW1002]